MLSDIVSEGMNQREEPLVALSAFFLMRFLQERVPFVGVDVTIAISIKLIENLREAAMACKNYCLNEKRFLEPECKEVLGMFIKAKK